MIVCTLSPPQKKRAKSSVPARGKLGQLGQNHGRHCVSRSIHSPSSSQLANIPTNNLIPATVNMNVSRVKNSCVLFVSSQPPPLPSPPHRPRRLLSSPSAVPNSQCQKWPAAPESVLILSKGHRLLLHSIDRPCCDRQIKKAKAKIQIRRASPSPLSHDVKIVPPAATCSVPLYPCHAFSSRMLSRAIAQPSPNASCPPEPIKKAYIKSQK
jgi:hypothetical protein